MTCVSLELFQMGGGVQSSQTPSLHEHSWAVLSGMLPHWDSTRVCLNMQSFPVTRRERE